MIAPIDFIREKYIEPNHITQDMLCDSLKIGKKTISELYQHKRSFTIHTAKKFARFFGLMPEFILMKQIEYDLAQDKKEYEFIKPYAVIALEDKKINSAKWILATINNSISDKRMHYSIDDLNTIFSMPSIEPKYHYAITTIFKEVMYEDVVRYCELHHIKKTNIKKLYEFYKSSFNAKGIKQYEWILEEL
jgi:addiction module HigA family antidote